MERLEVECLRCGERWRVGEGPARVLAGGECPRCAYVGWAPAVTLSEPMRRALRDRPVERRRLHAA